MMIHRRELVGLWPLLLAALSFLAPPVLSQQLTYRGCYDVTGARYSQDTPSVQLSGVQPAEQRLQACADFCATGRAASGAQRPFLGQGSFPRPFTNFRNNDNWCYCPDTLTGSGTTRTPQQCSGGALTLVYEHPTSSGATGGAAAGGVVTSEPLDRVWYESESGWSGVWTRRGTSNTFDAVWTHGASRVTAVLTIQVQGDSVNISRRQSSDGNDCNYTGLLAADRRSVSGTYTCNRYPGPYAWNARIGEQPSVPLGSVWRESESGWNGVWTRRGTSNTFDAVWTHGASRVTAVLTIQVQGDSVNISRRQSSDGNDCNYSGRLAADRRSVSGTYTCNRFPGPYAWNATIQP